MVEVGPRGHQVSYISVPLYLLYPLKIVYSEYNEDVREVHIAGDEVADGDTAVLRRPAFVLYGEDYVKDVVPLYLRVYAQTVLSNEARTRLWRKSSGQSSITNSPLSATENVGLPSSYLTCSAMPYS